MRCSGHAMPRSKLDTARGKAFVGRDSIAPRGSCKSTSALSPIEADGEMGRLLGQPQLGKISVDGAKNTA